MVGRGVTRTGYAADLPFAQVGCRVARAWPRRPDCWQPRDQPPDAIANSRDRTDSCGNTLRNQMKTGSSVLPTTPLRSTVPNPATPALSRLWLPTAGLPRPMAGASLRSASQSRRQGRATGARMSPRAAVPPDIRGTPATTGCAKPPDLRRSRSHNRYRNTIADCTRRCSWQAPDGSALSNRMNIRRPAGCSRRCCIEPRRDRVRRCLQ